MVEEEEAVEVVAAVVVRAVVDRASVKDAEVAGVEEVVGLEDEVVAVGVGEEEVVVVLKVART